MAYLMINLKKLSFLPRPMKKVHHPWPKHKSNLRDILNSAKLILNAARERFTFPHEREKVKNLKNRVAGVLL